MGGTGMDVVLSILHFLGWTLLAVLIIVLIALLMILFTPLKYLIEGQVLEETWLKAKVHWLWKLIRASVSYGDDLIYAEVHLFWKKLTFSVDLTKKEATEEAGTDENEPLEETQETQEEAESVEQNASDKQTESIVSKIKGMIERIKEIYPKLKKIITDEKNKAAVVHIKDEILYLIKILLPKKSKIDAVFSTGSPDTTGQAFGILACFPGMYQQDWKLLPNFESEVPYFKGSFWGKGKFYGYQLVGIVLRILFDKNCRRLYTIINKFIKWLKKDEKSEGK